MNKLVEILTNLKNKIVKPAYAPSGVGVKGKDGLTKINEMAYLNMDMPENVERAEKEYGYTGPEIPISGQNRPVLDKQVLGAETQSTPTTIPTTTPTPALENIKAQTMGVGDTGNLAKIYGSQLTDKIVKDLPTIEKAANTYGMPLGKLLGQYWQESSFGTNPNINSENWAGAAGPFQIRDTFTNPEQLAYPAFKDLYINPDDRYDLEKSADFAGKHYRRLSDYYNPDQAITSYYGDKSYLDLINGHEKGTGIQAILDYINSR